jgi:hypothetical protein
MIDIDPVENPGGNVFALTCRLNHSCEPNIEWKYNRETGFLESIALADVEAGEELLTDYTAGVTDEVGQNYSLGSRVFKRVCCHGRCGSKLLIKI